MTKNILIVEDDFGISTAVKVKLKNSGYNLLSATSVEEAMELFKLNKIDLVWLDHYLKGKETGLDFIAFVKSNEKDIPVFVVTNTASADEKYSYLKLGADRYYIKTNHTLSELVKEVEAFV